MEVQGASPKSQYGNRLEEVAVKSIEVAGALMRTMAGRHVASQLLRSGTSAGANFCEAQCAESRADFVHKMQIVVKELRETQYWLRIALRSSLVRSEKLNGLSDELNQLIAIGVKSVLTAKRGGKKP